MEEHLHVLGEISNASPLLEIMSKMPKDAEKDGKDLMWNTGYIYCRNILLWGFCMSFFLVSC